MKRQQLQLVSTQGRVAAVAVGGDVGVEEEDDCLLPQQFLLQLEFGTGLVDDVVAGTAAVGHVVVVAAGLDDVGAVVVVVVVAVGQLLVRC